MQLIQRTLLVAILTSVFSAVGVAFPSPPAAIPVQHIYLDIFTYRSMGGGHQSGYLIGYLVTSGRRGVGTAY